ncbi:MAG: alpha-ketoglutarate-dependent dioxygenase AlkB [Deltaproteobacteria bacterium]|nr:alpha-ketoglutarate-dependent dioxygenase AlkB [Deltaproteobacteria bacterium]
MTALEIRYTANALPDAADALSFMTREVRWIETMRARKTASFGLPYNYSGQAYAACEMPPVIASIRARAAALAAHPFNNCLCNLYETGRNTMGFHQDSYEGLVPSSLIAIASLGATRTLVFRSIDRARVVAVPLEHGSILLMNETTQREWQHAVKREPDAGLRVSLTFRQIATQREQGPENEVSEPFADRSVTSRRSQRFAARAPYKLG